MRFESHIQSRDVPLTNEQIQRVAPSVFAVSAHESRSDRFSVIPTVQVLEGLRREGFEPFYAGQSRARLEGRRAFTKHLLRLRQVNLPVARQVGDYFPEVVITNANDGSSAYDMAAGIFRLVCLNGAVVGEHTVPGIHVRHVGDIVGNVIEGSFRVVKDFEKVTNRVEEWKQIRVNQPEALALARAALVVRYGDQPAFPVQAEQLIEYRRNADQGEDLWTRFNVLQEHLVRGGVSGRASSGRRLSTRAITGVSQNVELNKALWQLAEEFAKLKTVH